MIASVSGGKDSAALALYLKENGIPHERVFMDTGWEHPETYEYLRGPLTDAIGAITEIRGEHSFESLIRKKGMFPSRIVRFCTTELKVIPVRRYIESRQDEIGDVINAVGIRRAESKARSEMLEWEWSDSFDCWVWRPLVNWTKDDVLAIHKRHGLAMNPLYERGASRVGCWPCIHARKSELAMIARVDPERLVTIRKLEADLNVQGHARDRELGREEILRSMFWFHKGTDHIPIPIDQAIEWANSKRGEWQLPGASDGCVRHGVCQTEDEI